MLSRRAGVAGLALALSGHLMSQAPVLADPSAGWRGEWPTTDFSRTTVPLDEILSGGPPRDGIPAIDGPVMVPVADKDLPGREPSMTVELPGAPARAYPVRYLMWHEIVNDEIGGRPVTVTFCPLCNSGLVFDGRLGDLALTFGVTGKLRHSDLVMYDRETESWWQQFTGEGDRRRTRRRAAHGDPGPA